MKAFQAFSSLEVVKCVGLKKGVKERKRVGKGPGSVVQASCTYGRETRGLSWAPFEGPLAGYIRRSA